MAVLKYKTKNGEYKTLDMIVAKSESEQSVDVLQTTGTSTTGVMSQNAVTEALDVKLDTPTAAVGSATKPIYFNSSGVPTACTYTLGKSVSSTAKLTDTTYSAGAGITLSGTTFSNSGVRSIATGSSNGTISVNTGGTTADVAIKGLGSNAYTSTSYLPLSGGTISDTVTLNCTPGITVNRSSGVPYIRFGKDASTIYGEIGCNSDGVPQIWNSTLGAWSNILYGGNSSVSKSGETLTVKINGTSQSLTNTNTTYSAGTGLSLSGTTFNHASSVTAGTAGTSSATSGATLAVPYVTVNATGHVTGYGTHTHTISGFSTTDTKVTNTASVTAQRFLLGISNNSSETVTATSTNASVYMQNGYIYAKSDERLKDFENDVVVDFDALKSIPKKYFRWKSDPEQLNIGTSAQALQKVYPELVTTGDVTGEMGVNYQHLSVVALAAIDKLHEENQELKKRLDELESKLK